MFLRDRITEEKSTVTRMILLYCRNVHGDSVLCDECNRLNDYAIKRLDNCRFGENKPVCAKCPVHCYAPQRREKIREVMRYAGPRMLLVYSWLAILHIYRKIR
ncbi:MAG: nitrous oxide-stimulated promoter family protein [Bacteroidota bacterium]|nr:nitrous oxide-stimulated promoter family protein [Bacteroidota bacterium]